MKDKHSYIIIALLVVIIVLLIGLKMEIKKPAAPLVNKATENVVACREAINAWNAQYDSPNKINDATRNELSSILADCSDKLGETGR